MTEPGVKRVMVLPTVMLPLVGADVSVGKAYMYNEQILDLLALKWRKHTLTGRVGLVDGQETMNGAAKV